MSHLFRFGSVCSGIEAASVAWHPLGWRTSFLSEIEAFPRAVLMHHYPDTPLHGDFTTIQAGEYDPIDLLVGGTPCQSFSIAGLRGGLADDRGNLALEYLRLADRLRPRWLVRENVPGVLSSNGGRDFGAILGGMVELGYGFAYRVLDAQHFGVPQRRRRVFVVGHSGDWRRAAAVLFERHSLQGNSAPRREAEQSVAPTLDARAGRSGETSFATSGGLIAEAFGGNNTAGPIEIATALNACASASGRMDFESETFVATTLRARDLSRGVDSDCTDTLIAHTLRAKSNLAHRPDIDTLVTHSLRGEGFDVSEDGTGRGTPLVPAFAIQERAVCENVNAGPQGAGFQEGVAYTLEARNKTQYVASAAVRRLTPRECERLQGFPDDYTLVPHRGKPAADGPRYKALGNSMAVPVMAWIGERIQQVEAIAPCREAAE